MKSNDIIATLEWTKAKATRNIRKRLVRVWVKRVNENNKLG